VKAVRFLDMSSCFRIISATIGTAAASTDVVGRRGETASIIRS
jgi:hypothetical protein